MIKLIFLYATSTGLQRGLIFLASLILARVFTLEEIGVYILVQTLSQLIIPLLTLNVSVALMREASEHPIITRKLLCLSSGAIFVLWTFAFFIKYLAILPSWISLGLLLGPIEAIWGLAIAVLQGKECANIIFKISLIKTGTFFCIISFAYLGYLSMLQVLNYQLVFGVILSILALICAYAKLITHEQKENFVTIKQMVNYSMATLPHTIALWLSISSDRLFLGMIEDKSILGGYALAYTMAQTVMVLISGIITAVPPRVAQEPSIWRDSNFVIKFMQKVALSSFGVILIILFAWKANEYYFHFISSNLPNTYLLICIIGVAFSFSTYYVLFASYMYLNRETNALSFFGLGIAPINLILMYLLILKFGELGAGIGLICSYLLFGLSYGCVALRLEPSLKLTCIPFMKISLLLLTSSIFAAKIIQNL
ncbi:MAG: oligosaccharide flippase family protein [Legionellaceae bacterium]|nr:oligosaccharide flippase family protein [Legionellaceae bacterium]